MNSTIDDLMETTPDGGGGAAAAALPIDTSSSSSAAVMIDETNAEFATDAILGLAFLLTTIVAAKRMAWSQSQGGAETTVVTAFYSLILLTSFLRAVWFLIPKIVLEPTYTPSAVMAYTEPRGKWIGTFISEVLVSLGSLCLFSIFILILVYWADILKKYFFPGARRTKPMITFLTLVGFLAFIELLNAILFLCTLYSSEGMLLINSLLLATVSIICVCEITIFSNKFRTVLMTLGAINQVSTESQVKRIMWITVTGNLFFVTRAIIEVVFAFSLIFYWYRHGTVSEMMNHGTYDAYVWVKHLSEVAILCLMLYILQSRFTTSASAAAASAAAATAAGGSGGGGRYEAVPDADPNDVYNNEEGNGSSGGGGDKDIKAVVV